MAGYVSFPARIRDASGLLMHGICSEAGQHDPEVFSEDSKVWRQEIPKRIKLHRTEPSHKQATDSPRGIPGILRTTQQR